jgi:aminopeptidase
MNEPRWGDLARILVTYSTRVARSDHVLIVAQEADALPLADAVYAAVVRAGGLPYVQFSAASMERSLLLHGDEPQIAWAPEPEQSSMAWADVCIVLRGWADPALFVGLPAARVAAHRRAMGVISGLRTSLTRWTLCRVPGAAWAQSAGLTLGEAMDLFWRATLRDWSVVAHEAARWREILATGEEVRILAPGTDLVFSTQNRRWVVGDGHINMPDGELYTAPRDGTMQGTIAFSWPATLGGQVCDGVRLAFRDGEVVAATAATNEALLHAALAIDEGARRPGEVGIGINAGITRRTGDPLCDEKIAGTLHLALGRAYAECGGVNASALHWDLVTDLRREGEIRVDELPVFRNGVWLSAPR